MQRTTQHSVARWSRTPLVDARQRWECSWSTRLAQPELGVQAEMESSSESPCVVQGPSGVELSGPLKVISGGAPEPLRVASEVLPRLEFPLAWSTGSLLKNE